MFGGLWMVFSSSYLQLLPLVASQIWMGDEHEKCVVCKCASNPIFQLCPAYPLWIHVKVLRLKAQARQSNDLSFKELVDRAARGGKDDRSLFPLRLTASIQKVYKHVRRWHTANKRQDVNLKNMILCQTSSVLDAYRMLALEAFPGFAFNLYSATTVVPRSASTEH